MISNHTSIFDHFPKYPDLFEGLRALTMNFYVTIDMINSLHIHSPLPKGSE